LIADERQKSTLRCACGPLNLPRCCKSGSQHLNG
jgi:hypothetical protein